MPSSSRSAPASDRRRRPRRRLEARPLTEERRSARRCRQFLREVRQELRKVDWPTRKELVTYTIVVLVTIAVLTTYVFLLDYAFAKAIFRVLDQ